MLYTFFIKNKKINSSDSWSVRELSCNFFLMHLNDKHGWQNFGCDTHLLLSLRGMKLHVIEENEIYFFEAWSLRNGSLIILCPAVWLSSLKHVRNMTLELLVHLVCLSPVHYMGMCRTLFCLPSDSCMFIYVQHSTHFSHWTPAIWLLGKLMGFLCANP